MINKAETTGRVFQVPPGSNAVDDPIEEQLYFELKDKYHTFQIGLSTMLECIAFAIEKNELPTIDQTWWSVVRDTYGIERPRAGNDNEDALAYEEI